MEAKSTRRFLIVVIGLLTLLLVLVCKFRLGEPVTHKLSSPVCDKVTFVRGQNIYVANPDGSDRVRLVHSPSLLRSNGQVRLAWSPDETMLAYSVGDLTMYDARLYIVYLDGANEQSLGEIRAHSGWGWSPDSKYIYEDYSGTLGLHTFTLYTIASGEILCTAQYDGRNPTAICGPFDIFYGKWWLPHQTTREMEGHRWALAPELAGVVVQGKPHLSPDKQWVAFSTYNVDNSDWRHHIARANGENLLTYYKTEEWEGFCLEAAWSPDSRRLAFAFHQDDEIHLSIVSLNDGNTVPLAHIDGAECPYDIRWHDNGQRIGFSTGQPTPQRWYAVEVASNGMVSLPLDERVCSWSQNGDWLGCYLPDSVAVLRIDQIKRFDLSNVKGYGAWSPSDRWFGFGTVEGIFIFDTATSEVTQVSDEEGMFAWTPACR